MKIISLSNQKGGVGKTTTSVNLSACLAELGVKVLLLDLDPQANASSAIGISSESSQSIYPAILGEKTIEDQIIKTHIENLYMVPSHLDLAGVEVEMTKSEDHLKLLRSKLNPIIESNKFDFCILDTPPSLGVLMTSALAAADEIIIPLQCEYFGLEGLSKIVHVLDVIKNSGANPEVIIEGIVLTLFDKRTNLAQQVVEDVKKHFEDIVYETIIPRTIKLGEAPSFGKTIIEYERNGTGSISYRALAKEFLDRRNISYKTN